MIYFAPTIVIISIWIAIADKSWRPFCLSVAFFSAANIVYAILKSIYSFHWETNVIYYVSQDAALLISLWAVNKFFKPTEYSESKNFSEPALMFVIMCMVIYRSAKWVGSTFPFQAGSVYFDIFTTIHYSFSVVNATLNTIVILLLLLGGGFYGKIWRIICKLGSGASRSMVYRKLSYFILSCVPNRRGVGIGTKREGKQ